MKRFHAWSSALAVQLAQCGTADIVDQHQRGRAAFGQLQWHVDGLEWQAADHGRRRHVFHYTRSRPAGPRTGWKPRMCSPIPFLTQKGDFDEYQDPE